MRVDDVRCGYLGSGKYECKKRVEFVCSHGSIHNLDHERGMEKVFRCRTHHVVDCCKEMSTLEIHMREVLKNNEIYE